MAYVVYNLYKYIPYIPLSIDHMQVLMMKSKTQSIDKEKSQPLYLQVENYLLGLIEKGDLLPGERVPSEDALSELFGISRMTARRALSILEGKELIYRVPGKGTFVKEKGRAVVAKTIPTIFVHLSPLNSKYHPFFIEVVEGMEHQAGLLNYSLTISSELESINNHPSVAGAILVKRVPKEELEKLKQHNIPFVLLFEHEETYGKRYPSVIMDGEEATFQETKHLLELGHRRIALFTGILSGYLKGEGNRRRVSGYRRALSKYGVSFDASLIKESDYERDKTVLMTEQLIASDPMPTASIACDDIGAGFIINTLKEKGLRVPEDMAVIGVGDLHMNALIYPPLTTFRYSAVEMGEKSILLLSRIAAGEMVESPMYIKGGLLVRKSCGWQVKEPLAVG